MKKVMYCLLFIFLFSGFSNAQELKEKKPDIKTLNYCIDSLGFPVIDNNVSITESKQKFYRELKIWFSSHKGYEAVLNINNYEQYVKIQKLLKIDKYPPKPVFVNTGNKKQDEINFKKAMKEWSENHPDYPQYVDTGNPKEDKERLRKAHLAFYDKYIKNK